MSLAGGTRLGHYEVVAAVGAGGMGEVYRARDDRLGRDVAIKVLPASVRADPQRLKRFEHEARATGGLNHPGIVSVFDVGEHDGAPYLVIELLDGTTLRERLRGGPLPVRKAVEYAIQIAQALATAHDEGIVHRDLKPDNLFVTRDGRVKILDFGLAKAMEDSPGTLTAADRTDSGAVLGTAGYMAPEQVRGKDVDHRADLFALGVVLHEMLTGAAPFARPTPIERALATLNEDPPPLTARDIPPALDAIVRRCLEKSMEERFQSARDLAFALGALATTTGSGASGLKLQAPRSRVPKLAVALVGIALALIGGYVIGSRASRGSVATRSPPLKFQRIAYRNGDIKRARFAPDGRTIVFGAQFDGDDFPHVYSAVPGGIEPRALYDRPMDLLDVAPNGELALALKSPSFALARASFAGGEPRVLAEPFGRRVRQFEDASWAPDGETLLQSRRLDGKQHVEYPAGTVLVDTPEGIVTPRVSPDGSIVAFTRSESPSYHGDRIELVDRTGHRRVVFTAAHSIQSIAWHPDGREIWFTTLQQLRAVSLDGVERLITELPGEMTIEQIAQDGRALLIRRDDTVHLVVHASDVERELTWQNGSFVSEISEDGKLLLFGEAGTGHTYVRSTDGRPAVRIADGAAEDISADGAWAVVFPHFPTAEFKVVPTGAGDSRTITLGPGVVIEQACFFRDGKRVLISAHEPDEPSRLWSKDVSTSAPARRVGPEGVATSVECKPSLDGTRALAEQGGKLVLVPLDGGEPIAVPGIDGDEPIAWGADGHSLYLRHRDDNDDASVLQLDLDTHAKTPKVRIDKVTARNNDWNEHVVITPDGSTYAYDYIHASSQLYLVDGLH